MRDGSGGLPEQQCTRAPMAAPMAAPQAVPECESGIPAEIARIIESVGCHHDTAVSEHDAKRRQCCDVMIARTS